MLDITHTVYRHNFMIISFRDKQTKQFAQGKRGKAFEDY